MCPAVLASCEGPVDTPWKLSRAAALAILATAHVLVVFLLIRLGSWYVMSDTPSAQPIFGSFVDRRLGNPLPLLQTKFKPELVRLEITPPRLSELRISVPVESAPSAGGGTGPSGPLESIASIPQVAQFAQASRPPALAVIHYVAPIYPAESAHLKEEGKIALAALVNAQGTVDQVKILSSTGSPRLDEAAVSAVRQWTFTPVSSGTGEPVWAHANFSFAPPARVLGVPLIVIPYAEVAHELDARISVSHDRHPRAPSTEASVRSLLENLIAAFPGERSQEPGESLEARLGHLGPIESLEFLGYINHGIQEDNSTSDREDPRQLDRTHWEVYNIKQTRGSSIWLVAVTRGSIRRIEAAVRSGPDP